MARQNRIRWQQEIEQAKDRLNDVLIPKVRTGVEKGLDFVGRAGVNESKRPTRPNTWTDRTGNLRKSIHHQLVRGSNPDKQAVLVIAGMHYAIPLHMRPGYRVLVPPNRSDIEQIKRFVDLNISDFS